MIELKDLTFLISLKIDSADRLNNLDIVMQYLQHNFNTNIVICEQDVTPTIQNRYDCTHVFHYTKDFFNRQKGVNLAAKAAKTSVIVHYDADILLSHNQITRATELILDKTVDVMYPYDGHFYDVPRQFHEQIKNTNSIDCINVSECTLFNPHSVGGSVFFNTETFWKCGGANENFKGLGYEDNEIHERFQKLNCNMGRLTKPLFHLTHERKDTSYNYNPYLDLNKQEYFRIHQMTKDQLLQEVNTWGWK